MKVQVAMIRAQSSLTVAVAMSQEHQISFLKRNEPLSLELVISMMVELIAEQFNVKSNFNGIQIMDCTLSIIEKFWYLRPEEILFAFKQAKLGAYGSAYNKLDTPTILEWLHKYDTQDRMIQVSQSVTEYKQLESAPQVDIIAEYNKEIDKQRQNGGVPTLVAQSIEKRKEKLKKSKRELEFQVFQEEYYKNRKKISQ